MKSRHKDLSNGERSPGPGAYGGYMPKDTGNGVTLKSRHPQRLTGDSPGPAAYAVPTTVGDAPSYGFTSSAYQAAADAYFRSGGGN